MDIKVEDPGAPSSPDARKNEKESSSRRTSNGDEQATKKNRGDMRQKQFARRDNGETVATQRARV